MDFSIGEDLRMMRATVARFVRNELIPLERVVSEVGSRFGNVVGRIGIAIAMAAIIGQCLMESGAADKITRRFVAFLGEKYSSLSIVASGYVLSIPVFHDTVFYLLIPLARAMSVRVGGRHFVLYALSIAAGGSATHVFVPPTPGPLAMAETLNIDLGLVIIVVGIFLARILSNLVGSSTGEAGYAQTIVKYAIIALFTAIGLTFMGLADQIVMLAFGLILGSAAVATAIAFGLGGRDYAARLLDEWHESNSPAPVRRPPPPRLKKAAPEDDSQPPLV